MEDGGNSHAKCGVRYLSKKLERLRSYEKAWERKIVVLPVIFTQCHRGGMNLTLVGGKIPGTQCQFSNCSHWGRYARKNTSNHGQT